jgi:hypothetical protein
MSQTPQSVVELFRQYLHRQMSAQAQGLGFADPDGLVVPHEAAPAQPVDPRLAWENALAVVPHYHAGRSQPHWEVPPDWPALVAGQEPALAVAFCVGNFPQLVRNLQPLLLGGDLTTLRPSHLRPLSVPTTLLEWAERARGFPQVFLAVGVLRLARRFDEASALLASVGKVPSAWKALQANEEAALAWHRGNAEEARAAWQAQKASVPVLFNRGMSALFVGETQEAQTSLGAVVQQLPDTNAWHHLTNLYLALASARG